jgi:preprotein translocase subunit SecF
MALVLTVGVIAGTYSSIFVAGAVTLEIERRWPGH